MKRTKSHRPSPYPIPKGETVSISKYLIYLAIGLYIITFSIITIRNLNLFYLHAKDMGQFDNIVWNTLTGRYFMSTITEFRIDSWFSRHFSPILILLAPFYLIWNNPRMLLIIQSIAISITALPLFWLARDKIKNNFLALAISVSFLLTPKIHEAHIFDFHIEALAAPLIVFSFYFLYRYKLLPYFISLLLLLSCKEDTFLYALVFGFYSFFFMKKRKLGLVTALIGLIWGILAIKVIIPFYRGDIGISYRFLERYSWLGGSFSEIIKTFIFHPVYVIKNIFIPVRIKTLLILLAPVGFLPLVGGGAFFLILPATLEMILSSFKPQYELIGQYSLVVIPFIYIATVFGAYKFVNCNLFGTRNKKIIILGTFLIAVNFLAAYFFGYSPRATVTGYSPLSKDFKISRYKYGNHTLTGHKFLKMIPEDATVVSQCCMVPHLAHRKDIYLYRGGNIPPFGDIEIDYIFLDMTNQCFPFFPGSPIENILKLLNDDEYGILAFDDGWILLEKGYSTDKNKLVFDHAFNRLIGEIEGETLSKQTGRNIDDPDASGGLTRMASITKDKEGYLCFGPYRNYPKGEYKVEFILKTDKKPEGLIAHIDVSTNNGRKILAQKDIDGRDFKATNQYESFPLQFNLEQESNLEFRVAFKARSKLWVDKVKITLPKMSIDEKLSSGVSPKFFRK